MPLVADAAGLGRLTVLSAIGEPFQARVELISTGELDVASLTARIASPETYQKFNIPYTNGALAVSVERPVSGGPYLRIASAEYVREPVLPLLIELEWQSGRVVRSYSALLDLPSFESHAPLAETSAPPAALSVPAATAPGPVRTAEATAAPKAPQAPVPAAAPKPAAAPAAAPEPKPPAAAAKPATTAPATPRAGPAPKPAPSAVLDARERELEKKLAEGDQALTSAQDRVAQLEQTLAQLKREAEASSPAAKPEPAAMELQPAVEPPPAAGEPAKPGVTAPKDRFAVAPQPAPKPVPKPWPSPVEAPQQGAIADVVMENLPLVGAGVAVLLLAGLWIARRRRAAAAKPAAAGAASADESAAQNVSPAEEKAALIPVSDHMDPIEEAAVFVAYGREAQAAQMLEEAVAANPARGDLWLKLFEIHAARKDKEAFARNAQKFRDLTGGEGGNWLKTATIGLALDPDNPLYAAARGAAPPAVEPEKDDLEFGAESAPPTPADESDFGAEAPTVSPTAKAEDVAPLDFEIVVPPAGETTTDIPVEDSDTGAVEPDLTLDAGDESAPKDEPAAMDFKVELPKTDDATEPERESEAQAGETADTSTAAADAFNVDLGSISLDLDKPDAETEPGAGARDPHWHEVQEKFELVKAYQLLGAETDSIAAILDEIMKEGDAGQRAEARKMLDELKQG